MKHISRHYPKTQQVKETVSVTISFSCTHKIISTDINTPDLFSYTSAYNILEDFQP